MDKTLIALGGILLKGLPTFFLVLFLYFYLSRMFFRPLGKVLAERRAATEGARQRAEEAVRKAEQKAAEYEAALQSARAELYKEQEADRRKASEALARQVHSARERANQQLAQARQQLASDVTAAKQSLATQSEAAAEQIVRLVLGRGTAA
jgi:F-type H+-transporting ATPase subunit b